MGSRRAYDKLKKALYEAEELLVLSESGNGRNFDTISEAAAWVSKIYSIDPLFRGKPYVAVRRAHGNAKSSWADFEENCLTLNEDHMDEQTILHELAHLVTDYDLPFHGHDFCWNYLDLTLRWRGISAYVELRDALRSTGIFK